MSSGFSFAKYVRNSPALMRFLKPMAEGYANLAGYRKLGLRYDDLLMEENPEMQKALGRLSERESYDRVFRMKQAIHQSALHRDLPPEKWLKPEDDKRYVEHLLAEVEKENAERAAWDTMKVKKTA